MAMGRQTDGVLTAGRAACDICCTHEAAAAAAAAAAADAGDVAATVIHNHTALRLTCHHVPRNNANSTHIR